MVKLVGNDTMEEIEAYFNYENNFPQLLEDYIKRSGEVEELFNKSKDNNRSHFNRVMKYQLKKLYENITDEDPPRIKLFKTWRDNLYEQKKMRYHKKDSDLEKDNLITSLKNQVLEMSETIIQLKNENKFYLKKINKLRKSIKSKPEPKPQSCSPEPKPAPEPEPKPEPPQEPIKIGDTYLFKIKLKEFTGIILKDNGKSYKTLFHWVNGNKLIKPIKKEDIIKRIGGSDYDEDLGEYYRLEILKEEPPQEPKEEPKIDSVYCNHLTEKEEEEKDAYEQNIKAECEKKAREREEHIENKNKIDKILETYYSQCDLKMDVIYKKFIKEVKKADRTNKNIKNDYMDDYDMYLEDLRDEYLEEHDGLSPYLNAMFDKPSRIFEGMLPSEMVQVVSVN